MATRRERLRNVFARTRNRTGEEETPRYVRIDKRTPWAASAAVAPRVIRLVTSRANQTANNGHIYGGGNREEGEEGRAGGRQSLDRRGRRRPRSKGRCGRGYSYARP